MSSSLFGLIPAAGSGARFGGATDLPKQYQPLIPPTSPPISPAAPGDAGAREALPMILHSIDALLSAPEIELVFVVLAPGDAHFRTLDLGARAQRVATLYCGGATRRDSVLNGLVAASSIVETDDWVLVHDAARPCLAPADLRRLVDAVQGDAEREREGGGILALPVTDTLKRAAPAAPAVAGDAAGMANGGPRIAATVPRDGLWQAQTPQMFRHGVLLDALRGDPDATDEASAVEKLGLAPRLVEGSSRNLKVTYAPDLALAALILQAAGRI